MYFSLPGAVTSSIDNQMNIWDLLTGKLLRAINEGPGMFIIHRYSLSSILSSPSYFYCYKLIWFSHGLVYYLIVYMHVYIVNTWTVAISPDGRFIASGTNKGEVIYIHICIYIYIYIYICVCVCVCVCVFWNNVLLCILGLSNLITCMFYKCVYYRLTYLIWIPVLGNLPWIPTIKNLSWVLHMYVL